MASDLSELMLVTIDRASPVPVLRQVYLELRRAILAGAIPPGGKLPPTAGAGHAARHRPQLGGGGL